MKMKPYWILDIETGPLPESVQREIAPGFEAGRNLKDPEKIKAAVAEKEAAWLAGAALDPTRCEILAVGVAEAALDTPEVLLGPEKDILDRVRHFATLYLEQTVVGHNLLGFDIPMLCRRMWRHGIAPPNRWLDCSSWRAKWAFDTMLVWSCGNRDQRIGLDALAWHLGVGRKEGSGADFAKLFETDKAKALEYLRNDLALTEAVYLRMRTS